VEFRILGPLEVVGEDGPLALAAPKQRALLATLLVHAGEVLSVDRLVDALWGEQPPPSAEASLQNFVRQLRAAIGSDRLLTRTPGYVLQLATDDEIDAARFSRLLATARASDPAQRRGILSDALGLWRGSALAEFAYEEFARAESGRLDELRLIALEELYEADLDAGRGPELVPELERLAAENPLRERVLAQLMQALYRAGRQAEALQLYEDVRRRLGETLGADPGPALQAVHRAILQQRDDLIPGQSAEPDQLDAVVRALRQGRLVLVLGGEEGPAMAEQLALRFDCPAEFAAELPRIAEYISVTHGVGPLYDELHELQPDGEAGSVERAVARIAAATSEEGARRVLIVTTGFDDRIERALASAGVAVDVVSYLAAGPKRGRFLHLPPEGPARVIEAPNAYTELLKERPVVLRLHGRVDRDRRAEWESYAVSESDHIDYLAQTDVAGVLPVALAARLRTSHFVFLAYPVRHWSLRVFLHRVFGRERMRYRSWAVDAGIDPFERQLWAARGIDALAVPADGYAAALADRMEQGA
jgi:DNA-binding SARP family transcriptional activator